MSTRNRLVSEIVTELKAISITNGFTYDQDSNLVWDWQDVKFDVAETETALEVRDPKSDTDSKSGYYDNVLKIEIAILKSGETSRVDIRNKMNDVLKAMKNFQTNGSSLGVVYTGDEIEFNREKMLIGESQMFYNVHYKSKLWEI